MLRTGVLVVAGLLSGWGTGALPSRHAAAADAAETAEPLSLVVMDPLAAPLSCPCVEGYAQRKYEVLAEYLTRELGREVRVNFAESLQKALAREDCREVHLLIGKDSVARSDAARAGLAVQPLAQLTGLDGATTQHGMIVVPAADPAASVADLADYRVIFGPGDSEEKHAAARLLLAGAGIALPSEETLDTSASCSDGACLILEWGPDVRGAAVISSYAAPLLEGCGTINKGDLRVVATTAEVPFVTAFATDRLDEATVTRLQKSLLGSGTIPEVILALESLLGFVPLAEDYPHAAEMSKVPPQDKPAGGADAAEKSTTATSSQTSSTGLPAGLAAGLAAGEGARQQGGWPGFRGPGRDGHAVSLPPTLPEKIPVVWERPLHHTGLGGVAATSQYVVVSDRDLTNTLDVWHCFAADSGELLWSHEYPAPGKLDYDNSPRATPQIEGELVYLQGAFGDLACLEVATGTVRWQTHLRIMFSAQQELVWGMCASPLVVDGLVIVSPGAPEASLAALDAQTGAIVWQTPGPIHAFASPIVAELGGVRQIVTYDRESLGGWDVATGQRRWTLKPPRRGDFNVPTPLVVDGRVLIVSENNGLRLHDFDVAGNIVPEPVATYPRLAPDMSSPVVVGSRVFCIWEDFYCLDLARGLAEVYVGSDAAFADFGPLIAAGDRLLALGYGDELILIDAMADAYRVIARNTPLQGDAAHRGEPFAHPALAGRFLYLRGPRSVSCLDLGR